MQKQGPPAPLDESRVTNKKRKLAAVEGEVPRFTPASSADSGKKKRKNEPRSILKPHNATGIPKVGSTAPGSGKDLTDSRKHGLTQDSAKVDKIPLKESQGKTKEDKLSNFSPNGVATKSASPKKSADLFSDDETLDEDVNELFGDSDEGAPLGLGDEDVSDQEDGIDDVDVLEDEFDTAEAERLDALDSGSDMEDQEGRESPASSGLFDSDIELNTSGSTSKSNRNQKPMWSFDEEDRGSDSDEEQDDLTAANIAGLSGKLDAKAALRAADAQAELEDAARQTNVADNINIPGLDDEDDSDTDGKIKTRLPPDLQLLRTRIADTIRVLDDFKKYAAAGKTAGKSRSDYTTQLHKDMTAYYGYHPELSARLLDLFPPREAFAFFEANESPRPVVIRTNTLRTSRRTLAQTLINRGMTLEPVGKWSKIGLQVFETGGLPLGATPEYLAGHYIIQAASSFLPVMALDPQDTTASTSSSSGGLVGEKILDMSAAPGGKTTHIAAVTHNTGVIFANDFNKQRAKALIGNIHRLGVRNTIVSNMNSLEFPKIMPNGFDRCLLDAPCSGTGVIAKDPTVKSTKTNADFIRLAENQKKLILAAIDSVNHSGPGIIVYSTCSVVVEENEAVISYALRNRPNVKVIDTGLTLGKEGFANFKGKAFGEDMKLCRRFYPHAFNMDGFFVCKLKKIGPWPPKVNGYTNAELFNGETEDKTPVSGSTKHVLPNGGLHVNGATFQVDEDDDPFASFSADEDEAIMERARRNQLRRKGLDPRAAMGPTPESKEGMDDKAVNGATKATLKK